MGLFWDSKEEKQFAQQSKTINDLEETVEQLNEKLNLANVKIEELTKLINISLNSQTKLALDMNTIYDNITTISSLLQGHSTATDDSYTVLGWSPPDDDLPN